ncbi:MAG TPA: hypothetical protein VF692_00455, partial [Pyrinomonadaceae bacterium]
DDFVFWSRYLPQLASDTMLYAHKREEIGDKDFQCKQLGFLYFGTVPIFKIKNNTLLPNTHPLEFLFGLENIDRLRICEICKRVFWANRKDARGCSPKHNNLLRVRRSRSTVEQRREKWLNTDDRKDILNQNFSDKDGEK